MYHETSNALLGGGGGNSNIKYLNVCQASGDRPIFRDTFSCETYGGKFRGVGDMWPPVLTKNFSKNSGHGEIQILSFVSIGVQ